MNHESPASPRLLAVLFAGFTLLILLLTGAAYVAIGAIQTVESEAKELVEQEQATVRLIDEVQSEEGNLSAVFYALAAGLPTPDRRVLSGRLDALEAAIHRTTEAGVASSASPTWQNVRSAAERFIAEGRDTLNSGRPASNAFFLMHQNLIDAVAELASANFVAQSAQQRTEAERAAGRVRYSLILLGIALGVAVVGAIATVMTVNGMFRRLGWQAAELAQLSSRTMSDQEETARRFSHEMHDHFGQILSALEANLVAMQHERSYRQERMEDCLALIKDAVENVREMSQLLRPSILDDFGLEASVRWLAESFSERTDIRVIFDSSFSGRLENERESQLFRIAQEAFTNVVRHSKATEVRIKLEAVDRKLCLTISDNGQGIGEIADGAAMPKQTAGIGGLGLVGMRARARAAGGVLKLERAEGSGLKITVTVPLESEEHVAQNSNLVGR